MRYWGRAIRIAVLPMIHLCLCAYVAQFDSDWLWMRFSVVDLPLVFLQVFVGTPCNFVILSPLRLTIFGTLMWLCVGTALSCFFEWIARKVAMKSQHR